jgi:hypothetical protein
VDSLSPPPASYVPVPQGYIIARGYPTPSQCSIPFCGVFKGRIIPLSGLLNAFSISFVLSTGLHIGYFQTIDAFPARHRVTLPQAHEGTLHIDTLLLDSYEGVPGNVRRFLNSTCCWRGRVVYTGLWILFLQNRPAQSEPCQPDPSTGAIRYAAARRYCRG